ncbi:MAG TPA: DUF2157 domain-containing protein [Bryobacteraceae bacterium]|jgi:uncharacterized membrane protein|nr:DUF2157 domain-containing protein [Bryobacteraceae bacterium]
MKPQERADRLRMFQRELVELEREGVIELTPEQRARLDAHIERKLAELASQFDVDTSESQRQISLGMKIASALGGIALCAAVVLFLARYMGYWSTAIQVSVLVVIPIVLTIAAEFAARREKTLYYAALISIVTFAAFVANLSMLGSIFNLAPTPNALAVWGLFGLALAYHFGIRLVLAAGLISMLGWITATTNSWRGWWWVEFEQRPEELMLAGLALALVPAVIRHVRRPDFPAVFRLVGLIAFFMAMLFLSASGQRSYLPMEDKTVEHFYQMFGVVAAAATVWIGIRRNLTGVVNIGTAFFTIFLFFRLIDWWWDWMPKYIFFLLIGLVALGLVAVFKRLRGRMGLVV